MSVLRASHCPFQPYEVPIDAWLCSCLGRKLLGEAEMGKATPQLSSWCSQSAILSPSMDTTAAWRLGHGFRSVLGQVCRAWETMVWESSLQWKPLCKLHLRSDEGTRNCQRLSGLYRQRRLGDWATGTSLRPKQQGRALFGKRKMYCFMISCTLGWCYASRRLLLRSDSGSIPGSLVLGDWKYQAGARSVLQLTRKQVSAHLYEADEWAMHREQRAN